MVDELTFTEVRLGHELTARYSNYQPRHWTVMCDLPGELDRYGRVVLASQLRFGTRSPIPGIDLWQHTGSDLPREGPLWFRRLHLGGYTWLRGTRQRQLQHELRQLGELVRQREAALCSPGRRYYQIARMMGND